MCLYLKAGTFWLPKNKGSELTDPLSIFFTMLLQTAAPVRSTIDFDLIQHRLKGNPEEIRQYHQDSNRFIIQ